MGEKVGLLTVFLKSCSTAFQKQKLYVQKNRKFMKNSGLFLKHGKMVFLGLFFKVLILKGLFLVCLALFQKC